MELYRKVSTKEEDPKESGWYDTDKGELYYFDINDKWSCRSEYVSYEYPQYWYEKVEKS